MRWSGLQSAWHYFTRQKIEIIRISRDGRHIKRTDLLYFNEWTGYAHPVYKMGPAFAFCRNNEFTVVLRHQERHWLHWWVKFWLSCFGILDLVIDDLSKGKTINAIILIYLIVYMLLYRQNVQVYWRKKFFTIMTRHPFIQVVLSLKNWKNWGLI